MLCRNIKNSLLCPTQLQQQEALTSKPENAATATGERCRIHKKPGPGPVSQFTLYLHPFHPALNRGGLIKTGCSVAVCVVPLVKAKGADVRPVGAVLEAAQTVIAPGPRQIDASVRDAGLCRKAAVFKEEALRLLEGVGGSGGVADIPGVAERADLAVVEHSVAAAEYEVHGAFDEAFLEILAAGDVPIILDGLGFLNCFICKNQDLIPG